MSFLLSLPTWSILFGLGVQSLEFGVSGISVLNFFCKSYKTSHHGVVGRSVFIWATASKQRSAF